MSAGAKEKLYEHLISQFSELDEDEVLREQDSIESMLYRHDLTIGVFVREPIEQFLQELIKDNWQITTALTTQNVRNALKQENPSETISCLLPSNWDG